MDARRISATLLISLVAISTLASAQRFIGAPIYSAGVASLAVASGARNKAEQISLGDLDMDGKLDVMMSAGADGTATSLYLPGKGDGTFRTAQSYTIDDGPPKQVIGNFDSDGLLDVAVTSGLGGTVTVLLNTGAK